MTLTEHDPGLRADNLPSFFGGGESSRPTTVGVLKSLGRGVAYFVKPVQTFASHGDHLFPHNSDAQPSAEPFEDRTSEDARAPSAQQPAEAGQEY